MAKPRPLIIDCDTGRDDALTLWLALAMELPLVGVVTSYGNTTLANVTDNTARVLALGGREDIPLFPGAHEPSRIHKGYTETVLSRQAISGNGLCNLDLPLAKREIPEPLAPKELAAAVRALAEKHGPLDYVIIGPATNFAALCTELGEEIHELVAQVTMMGGKLSPLWEEDPVADFNLLCDPFAVRQIMEAGFTMRFIPMNATLPIKLELAELEALIATGPVAETAKNLMITHVQHFSPAPIFCFHDPSVLLAIREPDGFANASLFIGCEESHRDFGRLCKGANFPCKVYATGKTQHRDFLARILKSLKLTRGDAAAA